jgi:signal transduction histidine kinase
MSPHTRADLGTAEILHDLNNLLQIILQAADLISADTRHADTAAVIRRSVERCRSTLGIGRSGAIVPLARVIEDAVGYVRDSASINGGAPPIFIINVDPQLHYSVNGPLMERALVNLFVNAAQAAGNAGRIQTEICVEARRERDAVILSVRDNGPGIPEPLLLLIFTPRFSSHHGGAGLGLHIAKTSVEACGGSIAVERGESGGSIFTMRFPAKSANAGPDSEFAHLSSLAMSAG